MRAAPARKGNVAHGIAVQLALSMMSQGRASSKAEAARMAGISDASLKPSRLAQYSARNPVGKAIAAVHPRPDLMSITTDVDGKTVSAREAFSSGVTAALRVIARYGKRIGKLTAKQRMHLLDAKRWLEMSRANGLFAPSAPLALPSELGAESANSEQDDEPVAGSLHQFTEDDAIAPEAEATGTSCKVGA